MAEVDSFLALGDSFTEGMEDELGPDRRHLGWADRVATALAAERPQLVYGNLATRGRLLDQVLAEQLPVALELEPDLVTFHAGPNDVLRPGMELTGVAARYDEAVGQLNAVGNTVVLFTAIERAGGTSRFADLLATHRPPAHRRVAADLRWAVRYLGPWVGRRLRECPAVTVSARSARS